MNILIDPMSTQVQVQNATGSRLNTFLGALIDAGYNLAYRNYSQAIEGQLTGIDVFIVLTHLWVHPEQPTGVQWPPVIPETTDFTWSAADLTSIQSWVTNGGSLFLISSHTSFTPNDIPLAQQFDIKIVPAFFCLNRDTLTDPLIMTPTDTWPALSDNVANVQAWDSCGISTVTGNVDVILPFPQYTYDATSYYEATNYAFAVAKTSGTGIVVVAGHSGIAGDPGSDFPSPGQIDAGGTKQFLLNCVSYLGSS